MEASQFGEESPGELVTDQGYPTFKPDPLPPQIEFQSDLVSKLSEARGSVGQLSGIGQMVQESRLLLLNPFIRREAVFSSRIEGTYATVSQIYAHEAGQQEVIRGARRDDVSEVYNYVRATQEGLDRIEENEFTIDLIKNLHATLMEGTRGGEKNPGEFRDDQNAIGSRNPLEARYVPPPAHVVPYEMSKLIEFINDGTNHDPLIDIALAHYQFETIHPFFDGNGRMGRLVITLMFHKLGLLPEPFLYFSSFFNAHRDEYVERLYRINTNGEWEEWIEFFLDGVIDQSKEAFIRSKQLLELRSKYRRNYIDRRSETILAIIYELFKNPVITIRQASQRTGANYQPARRAINELEESGVLSEITGKDRYKVYQAPEIIGVIEKPVEELVDDVDTEFEKYEGIDVAPEKESQAALDDF